MRAYNPDTDYRLLVANLERTGGQMLYWELAKDLREAGIEWPEDEDKSYVLCRDIRRAWGLHYPEDPHWKQALRQAGLLPAVVSPRAENQDESSTGLF